MNLSPHFTLREATKSQTATRKGIDNSPPPEFAKRLVRVAESILEPVRAHYGKPFSPSSWYRCPELNRAIGSGDNSQHVQGYAVDFEVPGVSNHDLAVWCQDNLDFDQLILEFHDPADPHSGWVHCSYIEGDNRGSVITINSKGVHPGIADA